MNKRSIMALLLAVSLVIPSIPANAVSGNDAVVYEETVSDSDAVVEEDAGADEEVVVDETVSDSDAAEIVTVDESVSDSDASDEIVPEEEVAPIASTEGGIVVTEITVCSEKNADVTKDKSMDGNLESWWLSGDSHGTENRHTWEATFDKSYVLKEINLTIGRRDAGSGNWGYLPENLRVEVLKNGSYEVVQEYTSTTKDMVVTLPEDTTAEGVRLSFDDSLKKKGFAIAEITFVEGEAAPPEESGNDIVVTEITACPRKDSTTDKSFAMDGDLNTYYASGDKHTTGENRHIWEAAFDKSYVLKEIKLALGRPIGFVPENLRVEILKDGTYEIVEDYSAASADMTVTLPENTTAEGVRLSFVDIKSKGFSIREVSFVKGEEKPVEVEVAEINACNRKDSTTDKSFAMDGDLNTYYASGDKHTTGENRHIWEAIFVKSYSLKEIKLALGRLTGFVPENLRVEILKDGSYETVADYTTVSEDMTVTLPANTTAEGVRLSFVDIKSKGFSIREVSFVAAGEPSEPEIPEEPEEIKTPNTEKKVYADYHGPRYTRELDGNVGNWAYTGKAGNSTTANKYIVNNADMILPDGTRQLAVDAYPLAGMQSQMNPDYQEYQILLAKMANIDGFFIEWGYRGHGTDAQLEIMMDVAEKYDFELGIDWCDAWPLKGWITGIRPDIVTREQKVQESVEGLSELLEELYAGPVGALYEGHPMVYLFGNGFTQTELQKVTGEAVIPEKFAEKEPYYFRRASMAGSIDGEGKANFNYVGGKWHGLVDGPFGWIPERIRKAADYGFPQYDTYGTREDAISYLEALRKAQTTDPTIPVRNSSVAPGMNTTPCAGWADRFKYLDREDGELYKALWEYNVEYRDYLDVVYIATWNDYTEGSQIEPTVEDGYRELLTTQKYAYEFKGEGNLDTSGMHLPLELLELRTEARRLAGIGFAVDAQQEILDRAGLAISEGKYDEATALLEEARAQLSQNKPVTESASYGEDAIASVGFGEAAPPLPPMKNVALNKPVKANAQLNASAGPELAVDGSYELDSRWRTPNTIDEHWLEIDLQGEYEIIMANVYMGDSSGWPVNNFKLEYWENDEWNLIPGASFTENQDREVSLSFDPIKTTKVRFYSNEKVGRGVRVKEIELMTLSDEEPEIPEPTPEPEGWDITNGCYLTFKDEVTKPLQDTYYTGKVKFSYLDEGTGNIKLTTATNDTAPFGDFSVIASINKTNTGEWIDTTVELTGTHIVLNHAAENGADMIFTGEGRVKNFEVEFTTSKTKADAPVAPPQTEEPDDSDDEDEDEDEETSIPAESLTPAKPVETSKPAKNEKPAESKESEEAVESSEAEKTPEKEESAEKEESKEQEKPAEESTPESSEAVDKTDDGNGSDTETDVTEDTVTRNTMPIVVCIIVILILAAAGAIYVVYLKNKKNEE